MLTPQEVQKIAALARIKLVSAEEEQKYAETISAVLDYMKILEEVNTDNVEITSQVTGLENIVRDDTPVECEYRNDLIKQMSVLEFDKLMVPGVFESEAL